MRYFQKFKKLLQQRFSKEIEMWTSIDRFPIYNFHQTLKTGDLRFTIKNKISNKKLVKNFVKIEKNWEALYDQYLEHFGLAKEHMRKMELEDKIAKLTIDRWLKDEKSLETIIQIEKNKLNELTNKKQKSTSFEEDIAVIEKYMTFGLDTEKLSVKRFYTYIKLMKKDGEKNK